ncbi:hypothetical protein ZIOFF_005005 [Zingiber officinale]|uniref:Large ribosomal subunit protein uL15/eL18 domain-containing protein n=1 Tax=Zingiber officinale TaxID=94328 RepID=A0A8J5HVC1_ZINOF|nr:hypothetical protein ZIOFF_005005 [Zingiber officinale]
MQLPIGEGRDSIEAFKTSALLASSSSSSPPRPCFRKRVTDIKFDRWKRIGWMHRGAVRSKKRREPPGPDPAVGSRLRGPFLSEGGQARDDRRTPMVGAAFMDSGWIRRSVPIGRKEMSGGDDDRLKGRLSSSSTEVQALRQENQELRDWVTTLKRLVEGRVKVVEDGVRRYSSRLKIGYGFDSQETEDPQAEIRERDWYNVVTCHMDTPQAYVWHLQNFIFLRGPNNAREAVKHFGKAPGVQHSHTKLYPFSLWQLKNSAATGSQIDESQRLAGGSHSKQSHFLGHTQKYSGIGVTLSNITGTVSVRVKRHLSFRLLELSGG